MREVKVDVIREDYILQRGKRHWEYIAKEAMLMNTEEKYRETEIER